MEKYFNEWILQAIKSKQHLEAFLKASEEIAEENKVIDRHSNGMISFTKAFRSIIESNFKKYNNPLYNLLMTITQYCYELDESRQSAIFRLICSKVFTQEQTEKYARAMNLPIQDPNKISDDIATDELEDHTKKLRGI